MTPPTYSDLYDQLVKATHDTPGRKLDQDLRQLYERHPATFTAKHRDTIDAWNAGRITSPWAFLRTQLQRVDETRPVAEADAPDRERAIRLAETWIRNAGLYAPLEEVHRELYGNPDDPRGRLAPWHDDPQLRARIDAHWHTQQPRAHQAEADQLERAEKWKTSRTTEPHDRDRAEPQPATATLDPDTADFGQ